MPVRPLEILKTYIFGWIIYPVIILAPLVIAINEVYTALQLPELFYTAYIVTAIAWLAFITLFLYIRHEKKGKPKT